MVFDGMAQYILKGMFLEGALQKSCTVNRYPTVETDADFESLQVKVGVNNIFARRYGKGPAILMVHGFPRTNLMWRFLAPKLAEEHTIICVDLRAYGRSGIP